MVKAVILSLTTGMLVGYGAAWWVHAPSGDSPATSPPVLPLSADAALAELDALRREVELKQQENALLLKMVRAGLNGDIATHMQTYRELPGRPRANADAATQAGSPESPQPAPQVEPVAFIQRISKADIALQKQALSEGWAGDGELAQARRELWAEAKETLTEDEYLQGLHGAGIPNVLFFGEPKNQEAAQLGLKYGDVLTHVAGVRVYNRDDLRLQLENMGESAQLELTFSRTGQVIKVQIANLNQAIELYGDSLPPQKIVPSKS